MKKIVFAIISLIVFGINVPAQTRGDDPRHNLKIGALFVMTNQTNNAVMAFWRNPGNGRLTLMDTEPTGGAGNPIAIPPDPPTDALASQGSLIRDEDNEYLYAVNAGSNEISVLAIGRTGLSFVQKVPSGGIRPISLALHDGVLYVLNEGGLTPNVTGFRIADDGTLTPIFASTQNLIGGATADPAQVGFNNAGTRLFVTEKMTNQIDIFPVGDGTAGAATAHASNGTTPFGFAVDSGEYVYISEAFGGMPGQAAVTSYDADENFDIVTASLGNGQTASCWLVLGGNGGVFVSNTGSNTISSYHADVDGNLTLANAVAADTGAGSFPIDIATGHDGRYLYVLESGSHTISAWLISRNSSTLHLVGKFGTLPAGAQGITAR
jgi:6-phosphogluconolactonase